jgi:uncharacterized damage-inducible protein DinB
MQQTLQRLFEYKAWADDNLLKSLAQLGSKSPTTELAIRAMSHAYVVDRIFAAHLRRADHGYNSANLENLPTLEVLAAQMRASDQEFVDYVARLSADQLAEQVDFTFTDGAPGRMSREEMLMHVITHGVGHRGQVSAVMLLKSLPAAKDGFTSYLHEAEPTARRRAA